MAMVSASSLAAPPTARDSIAHFYEDPDLDTVSGLIEAMAHRGLLDRKSAIPPVVGFLAALFERHPGRVDGWVADQGNPRAHWITALALAISGHRQKAIALAQRNGWAQKYLDVLNRQPAGLRDLPLNGPTRFDIMWGASFATGDPVFTIRILDKIEEGLELHGFAVDDVAAVADSRPNGRADRLKSVRSRLGDDEFVRLLPYGIALWGVASNAAQHSFVAETVEDRIAAAPNSALADALRRGLFLSKYPIVAKAAGKSLNVIVSQTADNSDLEAGRSSPEQMEALFQRFDNVFARGSAVFLAVLIKQNAALSVHYSMSVTRPDGKRIHMGPFDTAVRETDSIVVKMYPLPIGRTATSGIYTIRSTFSAGETGELTVENRLLLTGH